MPGMGRMGGPRNCDRPFGGAMGDPGGSRACENPRWNDDDSEDYEVAELDPKRDRSRNKPVSRYDWDPGYSKRLAWWEQEQKQRLIDRIGSLANTLRDHTGRYTSLDPEDINTSTGLRARNKRERAEHEQGNVFGRTTDQAAEAEWHADMARRDNRVLALEESEQAELSRQKDGSVLTPEERYEADRERELRVADALMRKNQQADAIDDIIAAMETVPGQDGTGEYLRLNELNRALMPASTRTHPDAAVHEELMDL